MPTKLKSDQIAIFDQEIFEARYGREDDEQPIIRVYWPEGMPGTHKSVSMEFDAPLTRETLEQFYLLICKARGVAPEGPRTPVESSMEDVEKMPRKRGRPKGSKNKVKDGSETTTGSSEGETEAREPSMASLGA